MNNKQVLSYLSLYSLSTILLIAGLLHFIQPELFLVAMPNYLPFHLEIIYITGALEYLFAIGLTLKKTRRISAIGCSIYFIAILPAHIHVSVHSIPIFGINSPAILWFRTFSQGVFIYWAYRLRSIK